MLLFVRPAGVYLPPKMLRIKGKSVIEAIEVTKKDMPISTCIRIMALPSLPCPSISFA